MKKGIFLIFLLLILILIFSRITFYFKTNKDSNLDRIVHKEKESKPKTIKDVSIDNLEAKPLPTTLVKKNSIPELPLSIENITVSNYEGKSADFLPLINCTAKVETSIQTAVKMVEKRSGIYPTKNDDILIVLTESKNLSSDYPYDLFFEKNNTVKIKLSFQEVLFNCVPIQELVASIIAETLLIKRQSNFSNFPRFFKFGLSASLSGLSDYLEKQEILKIEKEGGKPNFSLSSETTNPVLNSIFVVKFLLQESQINSLEEYLKMAYLEDNFNEIISKNSKFSLEEMEQNYIKYAINRYVSLTKSNVIFRNMVDKIRSLKEEEALSLLQDFLKNNPTDLYYGEGLYYLGYINYRLGNLREAEQIFNNLLTNHSFDTISQGKAHYFLGRCYQLRGFNSLAFSEYRYAALDSNPLLSKVAFKKMEEMAK